METPSIAESTKYIIDNRYQRDESFGFGHCMRMIGKKRQCLFGSSVQLHKERRPANHRALREPPSFPRCGFDVRSGRSPCFVRDVAAGGAGARLFECQPEEALRARGCRLPSLSHRHDLRRKRTVSRFSPSAKRECSPMVDVAVRARGEHTRARRIWRRTTL